MPQDPNLYGQPPPKKRRNNMALSSSLDFTAQLTSLMSTSSTTSSAPARPRPSRAKDSIFAGVKSKPYADDRGGSSKARPASAKDTNKLNLRDAVGTEEESSELARTRRKMEEKARLYAAMRRGDYVPKENETATLIDFDRKWAEAEVRQKRDDDGYDSNSGSDDGDGDDDGSNEIIEYEDEFGRLRRGTKADKERLERQRRRGLLGAEELERMSARPAAPAKLLYGDAIQTMAFNPDDPEKMEELARKRDRSATPPEMKHYDADSEIRTKGTGFYKFSKDEETRSKEFQGLEEERQRTEAARKEREEKKEARRREIEQRRKDVEARRAMKMADSFLDGLAADIKKPEG